MGNSIIPFFIFAKILKKIQQLAFTDKVKVVKSYIPEKSKVFIENNLLEELKYFQKILGEINIYSDPKLLIPEYKIDLLNKSKRLVNSIENINAITEVKKLAKKQLRATVKKPKKI